MLKKSVLINLSIGGGDFSKAIGILLSIWVLSMFCMATGNPSLFLFVIPGSVAVLVYSIRGMNKIFNSSLFSETGAFYMALPLSSREIVLGKIIASAFFTSGCMMVFYFMSMSAILIYGVDDIQFADAFLSDYLSAKLSPNAIALLMGLIPLRVLLQQLLFCSFAMAALLFCGLIRPGKLSVIAWLVIYFINNVVSKVVELVYDKLLEAGFNYFLLEGVLDALYALGIFALVTYCIKALATKYNV